MPCEDLNADVKPVMKSMWDLNYLGLLDNKVKMFLC